MILLDILKYSQVLSLSISYGRFFCKILSEIVNHNQILSRGWQLLSGAPSCSCTMSRNFLLAKNLLKKKLDKFQLSHNPRKLLFR